MITKSISAFSVLLFVAVLVGAPSVAFADDKDGGGTTTVDNTDCSDAHTACMNACVNSGTINENCGVECREKFEICKNVILETRSKNSGKIISKRPPAAVVK
jgi:hypothetical protein